MGDGKKGGGVPGRTSNNPGGRPKEAFQEREEWRKHGPKAREKALKLMRKGKTEAIQLAAAKFIIERGWGAPVQDVQIRSTSVRAVVQIPAAPAPPQIDVSPAARLVDLSPDRANGHAAAIDPPSMGADPEGRAEGQ